MTDPPSNTLVPPGPEHKRRGLRRLAGYVPHVRWLFGDDGQRDPGNYAEFARDFPHCVPELRSVLSPETSKPCRTAQLRPAVPDARGPYPSACPSGTGRTASALLDNIRGRGTAGPPPQC